MTTLVFEDARTRTLYEALHPEATGHVLFEELLRPLLPAGFADAGERSERFRRWLPPAQREGSVELEATVQALREALVLLPEHVEFVFGELPPTPKNLELRALLRAYLASPLSEDLPYFTWQLIEQLREGAVTTHGSPHYRFVRGERASALFEETANAFENAGGVESSFCGDLAAIDEPCGDGHPLLVISGDTSAALDGLGTALSRLLDRGVRPERIIVPFAGGPPSFPWLRHFLHRHRVPFRSLLSETPSIAAPSPLGALVGDIRADRRLPLFDRLRLASRLLDESAQRRLAPDRETLLRSLAGQIDEREYSFLRSLQTPAPVTQPPPERGLLIVPFVALPPLPGHHLVAFADETALVPARDEIVLREPERDLLHDRGFSLPRLSSHRERLRAALAAMARPRRGMHRTYTTLDVKLFPESVRRVRATRPPSGPARFEGWTLGATDAVTRIPVLSATQLETYARCPAQYFFSSRLKLRRRELSDSRYPLLFGQAAHRSLETYFRSVQGREPEDDARLSAGLVSAFRIAVKELAPSLAEDQPLFVILVENFSRVAAKVPRLEKELRVIGGDDMTPAFFEEKFEEKFEMAVGGGIAVQGKIDRIDRRADGSWLLIDYKTGNVDFTPDHVVRGKHFQALLYLLAAEKRYGEKGAGLVFYDLKGGEVRKGVLREEAVAPGAKKAVTRGHVLPPERLAQFKEAGLLRLKELSDRLAAGDYTPRAAAEPCSLCDYGTLCRRQLGVE